MMPLMIAGVTLGLAVLVYVVAAPGHARLPRARRRPALESGEGALADAADAATSLVSRALRGRAGTLGKQLDIAGIGLRPQDFAFLVIVGSIVLLAGGLVLGGGWLALPVTAVAPLAAALFLNARISARRKQFAAQLDGTLQLMSSSLRAGYSMMQALASVGQQSEEPTAGEFARVVNETRVGRPVIPALEEAAERMASNDFAWAAQAIAINREVGGSLAETLDGVGATIRERGQIKRHVAALSAEGRLSAIILMLLPIGIGGFLALTNPGYLAPMFSSPIGIVMLAISGVLLVVGGLWLRKTVEVKF